LCYSPENPVESRAVVEVYQDKEPAVELKKRLKHCFKIVVQKGNHNSINDNDGRQQEGKDEGILKIGMIKKGGGIRL
jgi:hypothetical protein